MLWFFVRGVCSPAKNRLDRGFRDGCRARPEVFQQIKGGDLVILLDKIRKKRIHNNVIRVGLCDCFRSSKNRLYRQIRYPRDDRRQEMKDGMESAPWWRLAMADNYGSQVRLGNSEWKLGATDHWYFCWNWRFPHLWYQVPSFAPRQRNNILIYIYRYTHIYYIHLYTVPNLTVYCIWCTQICLYTYLVQGLYCHRCSTDALGRGSRSGVCSVGSVASFLVVIVYSLMSKKAKVWILNKQLQITPARVGGFYYILSALAVVVLTSHSRGAWCHGFRVGNAEFWVSRFQVLLWWLLWWLFRVPLRVLGAAFVGPGVVAGAVVPHLLLRGCCSRCCRDIKGRKGEWGKGGQGGPLNTKRLHWIQQVLV